MQKLKAELVATPSDKRPFKVVVTRDGMPVSEQAVASEIAGRALITDIEKMSRTSWFDLQAFDGAERRKHLRDDMPG